jgi:hypothetical protein
MIRRSRPPLLLAAIVALIALGLALVGCSKKAPTAPQTSNELSVMKLDARILQSTIAVQNRHNLDLMRVPGVVAVGTGVEAGRAVIHVFTESKLAPGRLPNEVEGIPVVEQVNGKIFAMKGGGGGVSHTALQTPPIQLGTSGSPALDIANGFCCGGTLGSLVTKGGAQYILSNSHVLCGDVVSGGNGRVSTIGDDIIQPALIETGCSTSGTQVVADLSSLSTVYPPGSTPNVDCAIAQVRSGMVSTNGAILEIGTLSASTVGASIGQGVKKSGRTTGLTRSSISDVNVSVNVGYTDECGGTAFTKSYTGQIFISNRGSKFLNSGDSGSLLVEDVSVNPRAVGLCFAGGGGVAVANPIGPVLSQLGATMVGN